MFKNNFKCQLYLQNLKMNLKIDFKVNHNNYHKKTLPKASIDLAITIAQE